MSTGCGGNGSKERLPFRAYRHHNFVHDSPIDEKSRNGERRGSGGRRFWKWFGIVVLIGVVALGVVVKVVVDHAEPILKGRVIETLSTKFNGKVELDRLDVSVLKGLQVSGDGLRIFPQDEVVAAGATQALISLGHFAFHADFLNALFAKPMHVGVVYITGAEINIPPREMWCRRRRGKAYRQDRDRGG